MATQFFGKKQLVSQKIVKKKICTYLIMALHSHGFKIFANELCHMSHHLMSYVTSSHVIWLYIAMASRFLSCSPAEEETSSSAGVSSSSAGVSSSSAGEQDKKNNSSVTLADGRGTTKKNM